MGSINTTRFCAEFTFSSLQYDTCGSCNSRDNLVCNLRVNSVVSKSASQGVVVVGCCLTTKQIIVIFAEVTRALIGCVVLREFSSEWLDVSLMRIRHEIKKTKPVFSP